LEDRVAEKTWLIVAVVAMLLAAGCNAGGEHGPQPKIDFSDYKPWFPPLDDASQKADWGLDVTLADSDLADTSEWEDLAGTFEQAEQEGWDNTTKIICTPNMAFCHEHNVVQCNSFGDDFSVIEECSDGNPCTNDSCENAICIHGLVDGSCCYPECSVGELCLNSDCTCTPTCFDKECGSDGCDGSCGSCPEGWGCTPQGKCKCVPDCLDKECGEDGCGETCGYCIGPEWCIEGLCDCITDCAGKECGSDGCFGECGECDPLYECQNGTCVFSCPACPGLAECELKPFGGHVYYFCWQKKGWGAARDICNGVSAHLVTIASDEENSFLANNSGDNNWWIGYYQEWYSWEWKWVTGEKHDFQKWDENQPDNGGIFTEEDCTELKPNKKWNDDECGHEHRYICEFEP